MPTAPHISAIPHVVSVPFAGLMSKRYAANVTQQHRSGRATPSREIRAGTSCRARATTPRISPWWTATATRSSNTYTLNFSYGVGLVAEGTGVLLNNELDDFAAKPGVPNAFGLIGGDANAPGPGKRPLSSMTPTIVLKDGKPFLVTGSPGGSRIITAVLQIIANIIDRGMPVAEAVAAPRIHHQWPPDQVFVENTLAARNRDRGCKRAGTRWCGARRSPPPTPSS